MHIIPVFQTSLSRGFLNKKVCRNKFVELKQFAVAYHQSSNALPLPVKNDSMLKWVRSGNWEGKKYNLIFASFPFKVESVSCS